MKTSVHIITGFLGSGKTTLLSQILSTQEPKSTAVIVNELGEAGLDHSILNASFVKEQTILLNAGCMCCNKRDDLVLKLRALLDEYESKNEVLEKVIIETTGLANPAPIVFTLLSDAFLCHHFCLKNIITCIDSVNGISHLEQNEEAFNQVLASDCVVLTKSDLQKDTSKLRAKIKSLDDEIKIIDKQELELSELFGLSHRDLNLKDQTSKTLHNKDINSISLSFNEPLDWSIFGVWMSMLLHHWGSQILRVKGLIDIGEDFLVSINGVGHVIHPPTHIKTKSDKISKLVFITKNLDTDKITHSLKRFMSLSKQIKIDF